MFLHTVPIHCYIQIPIYNHIILYPYHIFYSLYLMGIYGNDFGVIAPPPTQVETAVRATLLAAFPGVAGAGGGFHSHAG